MKKEKLSMNDKIHGVTLPKGEKLLKYCRSRNCQCQEYVKCKKDGKRYHVPQCPIQKHLNAKYSCNCVLDYISEETLDQYLRIIENADLKELTDIPYKIKKEYLESLQDSVSMKEIQRENDGQVFYELTLPYLDRQNDFLQIYLRKDDNDQWILCDDGNTIENLKLSLSKFNPNKVWGDTTYITGTSYISHGCLIATDEGNILLYTEGNMLCAKCSKCDLVYIIHRFGKFLVDFETIAYVRNLDFLLN